MAQDEISRQAEAVHDLIPVDNMSDGFWIHEFQNGELTISCSFNRLTYRNFDIRFEGTLFFNLPEDWRLEQVPAEYIFRLSNRTEFERKTTDQSLPPGHIFAFDLIYFPPGESPRIRTFFVVADTVKAAKCAPGDASPARSYRDPFSNEPFPCYKNRVI
jgi:hypothetical protein